jgi:hypothetical protein
VSGPVVPPAILYEVVTKQSAVFPPSCVVTVIVALPAPMKLTTPLETVATDGLLVDQVTVLFVALLGLTVAVRVTGGSPAGFESVV